MVYSDVILLSPNDSATTTTTTTWASAAAKGYASVSDEVAVLAPAGRTGFYAVLAIVVAYAAVSALVIVLFCRAALWSLLEQAWSSVAQVTAHEDAQNVLRASAGMTDDEVARWIAGPIPKLATCLSVDRDIGIWRRAGGM